MFKSFLKSCAFFIALIFSLNQAHASIDMTDPYKMVIEVANKTFNTLKDNKDKLDDVNYRKDLIRQELMPYIDYKYGAYKVIGTSLKNTSKDDRDAFSEAFYEYIVATFADAFGKYTDQELVAPAYKAVGADEKLVNAKFIIRKEGAPDLFIIFSLRKNSKTGQWRAFDMVAENISMLSAKQSELAPLIRDKGLSEVTKMLSSRNAKARVE